MKPIIANALHNTLAKKEQKNKYAVPDYDFEIDNPEDSHSILAKYSLGAKQILDVGCGVGYIGKKVKSVQDCTIDGIEIDTEAAKIAANYYDSVLIMRIGDLGDISFQKFIKDHKKYDVIICGDIIEHLMDPAHILSIFAKKLTPDGKILISIPNIAHIDVIAGLLDGKFNYATCGILDSTHLRFWTERSFLEFISNVNERYGAKLYPQLIAQTHAESAFYDSSSLRGIISSDDCIVFQNVFMLTINDKSVPKIHYRENYQSLYSALSEIDDAKKTIQNLREQISNIEHSTSWKITAPIRKLGNFFGR